MLPIFRIEQRFRRVKRLVLYVVVSNGLKHNI